MADLIPAGRFAPAAWHLTDLGADGVDVGWCEDGTAASYANLGFFADRRSALAAFAAMEADELPGAGEALAAAGFVREEPEGLSTGSVPYILRRDGKAMAWVTYDLTATLCVPGHGGGSTEVASVSPPAFRAGRRCSLTEGRRPADLCIAAAVAAWRAHLAGPAPALR